MYNRYWYYVRSILISPSTQCCNIGVTLEVKGLNQDMAGSKPSSSVKTAVIKLTVLDPDV